MLPELQSGHVGAHTAREAIAWDLGIPIEQLRPKARIVQDLGMDTLDLQELLEALEEEFDVSFRTGAEESLRTVSDIERFVHDAQAVPAPSAAS